MSSGDTKTLVVQRGQTTAKAVTPKGDLAPFVKPVGWTSVSFPVFFSADGFVGNDILPLSNDHVSRLYRTLKATETALITQFEAASGEDAAFFEGQLGSVQAILGSLAEIQADNRGLMEYRAQAALGTGGYAAKIAADDATFMAKVDVAKATRATTRTAKAS
jgi:hypothetical protein